MNLRNTYCIHGKDSSIMKQVRIIVPNNTDGTDRTEIGIADIDTLPNGDMMFEMTITDPKIAELLGGTQMKGVISGGRMEAKDLTDE